MPDVSEIPYKAHNQPDWDIYYPDIDEETKQPIKLYLYIPQKEFAMKIPSYYKYLYRIRKDVYELNDSVYYKVNDTRYPHPPKKTFIQYGAVFLINKEAMPRRDSKPFKYQRNIFDIYVPLS